MAKGPLPNPYLAYATHHKRKNLRNSDRRRIKPKHHKQMIYCFYYPSDFFPQVWSQSICLPLSLREPPRARTSVPPEPLCWSRRQMLAKNDGRTLRALRRHRSGGYRGVTQAADVGPILITRRL
jgi:hypothetical protein